MWCAAVGCTNRTNKTSELTFFSLPKCQETANAWKIKLKREDSLPKKIFVCEKHFEDHCFDKSVDMRNALLANEKKQSRKLIKDAIPTVFAHSSQQENKRENVKERIERKKVIFNLFNSFYSDSSSSSRCRDREGALGLR